MGRTVQKANVTPLVVVWHYHQGDDHWHSLDVCWHSLDGPWHSIDGRWHSLDVCWHSLDVCWHSLDFYWHSLDGRWHSLDGRWHSLDVCWHSLVVYCLKWTFCDDLLEGTSRQLICCIVNKNSRKVCGRSVEISQVQLLWKEASLSLISKLFSKKRKNYGNMYINTQISPKGRLIDWFLSSNVFTIKETCESSSWIQCIVDEKTDKRLFTVFSKERQIHPRLAANYTL